MMKRLLNIMIGLSLLLPLCVTGISATDDAVSIKAETVAAQAGSTVEVDLNLSNNPGVLGAVLEISFDSKLVLTGARNGEAFSALTMTKPGKFTSPCSFVWDGQEISADGIKDGTILTLIFDVPDTVQPGQILDVKVSYTNGNIIDKDMNLVQAITSNGAVTIAGTVSPDIPEPTDGTTITVSTATANVGSTVKIDLNINNNPGVLGAVLGVSFDSRLTLVDAQNGEAFSALTMTKPGKYTSPCSFVWDCQELSQSDIKDGTILTLTFDVANSVKPGDVLDVEVFYTPGNVIDRDMNVVEAKMVDGSVTILSDSVVSMSGMVDKTGYQITIDSQVADEYATVVIAEYSDTDRFLGISFPRIKLSVGENTYPIETKFDGAYIKAFLLGDHTRPMCPALTLPDNR